MEKEIEKGKGMCFIPVSIGELFDKYSILQIKSEKIQDKSKLQYIQKELDYLQTYIDNFTLDSMIMKEIKEVNTELWIIEDKIRDKERKHEFDEEFISLARLVYKTNDKRSHIKNKINNLLNSDLNDIKSYSKY